MGISARCTLTRGDVAGILSRVAIGATAGVSAAALQGQAISQSIVPVRTGELRDDITVKSGSDDSSAWAAWGPDAVPYRWFIEWGTGKRGAASPGAGAGPYGDTTGMAAQPYQRPSMDEITPQILDIVAESIRSAL